ncbi:hypothetical protein [Inquilinus limosus]|uniref:hypothetical protein n=1 Tax=Inquilinus limosus TaxID=171674 RepID=UPI003F1904F4
MIKAIAKPSLTRLHLDSIDSADQFWSQNGAKIVRAPNSRFDFSLERWELPNFAMLRYQTTPFVGVSGPPEDPVIGGPAVCIVLCERGEGITEPVRSEAYRIRAGDLEIAGDDAPQRCEYFGDDAGITKVSAAYLPSDNLRALGAPVSGNTMRLLGPSPLRSVVDAYLRAFGSPETLSADVAFLIRNFTEVLSFVLRGSLTPGVKDSPGVLYDHYRRALQVMRRHSTASCRRFGC